VSNGRSVGVVVGSILAVVSLTVVIVVLAGSREPKSFAAGTPEAALQGYLVAWDDGNFEAAYAAFSSSAQRELPFGDFERAARDWRSGQASVDRLAFIDRSTGDSKRVTVFLIVEERYGEGFGAGSYRSAREVEMIREDGVWRIANPLVWLEPAEHFAFEEPKTP
jgi:hypothetical protein